MDGIVSSGRLFSSRRAYEATCTMERLIYMSEILTETVGIAGCGPNGLVNSGGMR